MNFLFPIGLLALITLPIILLLHLIRERRQRVQIPSLMLWEQIPRRQDGPRRRLLPVTLLLLLHLLIAGLLAFAISRPQFIGIAGHQATHTALLIDTSTSMGAQEGNTTRLDQARAEAQSIISAMQPADHMTIIALGPRPHVIADGGSADAALLLASLNMLQPAGTGTELSRALIMAESMLDPQRARRIIAIGDGLPENMPEHRVGLPFEWRQVGSQQPNRAIVTLNTRNWGNNLLVFASIANYANQPFTGEVQLYQDEVLAANDFISIDPGVERQLTWRLPASGAFLRLAINGEDALPADDQAFLNLQTARPLNVLLVSNQPEALQRALAAVPAVTVQTIATSDYQANVQPSDLTIFDGMLPDAWPTGSILVVNPPVSQALLPVEAEDRRIGASRFEQNAALLDGLGFGGVLFGDVHPITPPDWATVQLAARPIESEGPLTPLILRGQRNNQAIAIWMFNIQQTNLPSRLAFPLLTARTLRDLSADAAPAAIGASSTLSYQPDLRATSVTITDPQGQQRNIAAAAVPALDNLREPGLYTIVEQGPDGTLFESRIAVNHGSITESNLTPGSPPIISAPERDNGGSPQQRQLDLGPWLAAAALLILCIEWLYVLRRQ